MPPEWEPTRTLLRRLRWTIIKPLATRLNGDERSRLTGPGIEFAGVRDYQPGDDIRRIDWNLTARANTPFVPHGGEFGFFQAIAAGQESQFSHVVQYDGHQRNVANALRQGEVEPPDDSYAL